MYEKLFKGKFKSLLARWIEKTVWIAVMSEVELAEQRGESALVWRLKSGGEAWRALLDNPNQY